MDSKTYQKLLFTLIFIILIAIAFFIVKPFLTALLTAIVLSYIFYPLYRGVNKKISSSNLSALITTFLVVLIITLPLFFVLNAISKEAYTTYLLSRQKASNIHLSVSECQPADKVSCRMLNYFYETTSNPKIKYYIDTTVKDTTTRITEDISNIFFTIPAFILHLFITLFAVFFLLRDGKALIFKIERLLPLTERHRKKVFMKFNDMTFAVIYGSLIIAVIQGTLGGIGFFIFGVPLPFLWGLVMMFASLIPYVGSSIIWLPAALLLMFNGYVDLDTTSIIKGVLLLLYGIFVVSAIDNILKPKIIGDKGGLHPVLVLLGVVGGLKFLGFIGVMVGPILLAVLVTFMNIYEEEKERVL
jgi:predicted PurR-regulated permease PerM